MKHSGLEALMQVRDIRKIYADPKLIEQYNDLVAAIHVIDWRYEPPPPVHIATLEHLKNVLADLKRQKARGEILS